MGSLGALQTRAGSMIVADAGQIRTEQHSSARNAAWRLEQQGATLRQVIRRLQSTCQSSHGQEHWIRHRLLEQAEVSLKTHDGEPTRGRNEIATIAALTLHGGV